LFIGSLLSSHEWIARFHPIGYEDRTDVLHAQKTPRKHGLTCTPHHVGPLGKMPQGIDMNIRQFGAAPLGQAA
jgi:hypothetical protein